MWVQMHKTELYINVHTKSKLPYRVIKFKLYDHRLLDLVVFGFIFGCPLSLPTPTSSCMKVGRIGEGGGRKMNIPTKGDVREEQRVVKKLGRRGKEGEAGARERNSTRRPVIYFRSWTILKKTCKGDKHAFLNRPFSDKEAVIS